LSKTCGHGVAEAATIHGGTGTRLFTIWNTMKQRCHNPKAQGYSRYGGRGIHVCPDWKDEFINFRDWSEQNGYSEKLTLDRIDSNKGYSPENCRWVTNNVQARNKPKRSAPSSSKYIGVSYDSSRDKWMAGIKTPKLGCKNLGRFSTEEEAARARDKFVTDNNLEGFTLNF
jgi:hypothetical protein